MSEVKDKNEELMTLMKEIKAAADKNGGAVEQKFAAAERLITEQKTEFEAKVLALNEEMGKKGATLEAIQTQIAEMKAQEGRFSAGENPNEKKAAVIIADAFEEHFAELKSVRKGNGQKIDMKAAGTMTAAANLTGNVIATYDNLVAVRGRRRINIRDLIPVINSATGRWIFYRQNTPVGEGSVTFQSAPGATKPQLDYDLTEVVVNATFMAGWVLIEKSMMQDLPFLQNFVANELVEDFKRAESGAYFGQLTAGAAGDGTTASTVYAEKIIDWIATLMGNDWYANAIVTTPANWASVLKTKPNDYSVPGGIQIASDGTVLFCGIPLIAQNNIAAGKTLVGDFTQAAILQAEGMSVDFFEQDGTNVRQNLITARIEARTALVNRRPDAFIYA